VDKSQAIQVNDCYYNLSNYESAVVFSQKLVLLDMIEEVDTLRQFGDDIKVGFGLDGIHQLYYVRVVQQFHNTRLMSE
jgi:hypothetical protein